MYFYLEFIISLIAILLSVAFITLLERKILSYNQNRVGPNKVSAMGILQPVLDGIKLFLKEISYSSKVNFFLYLFSPFLVFILMFMTWLVLPTYFFFLNLKMGIFLLISCMGMTVYSTIFSGWASNSKYALLGSLRASAQSVSYEVSMSLILFFILLLYSSTSTFSTTKFNFTMLLISSPLLIPWFLSIVAECNRAPFDFAEGESELISGFNIEYGSVKFALIFLGEYGMILSFSIITLFFFTNLKETIILFLPMISSMLILRSIFPRFRYDKLMQMAWFKFLPSVILLLNISFFLKAL